jgi:cytochrome c biogenesis protein
MLESRQFFLDAAMILRFLTSLRLTLALLLGLALVSVAGTFNPADEGRYDLFFQSPWFRLVLALLAVNLTACTAKTILRNLRDRKEQLEILSTEQVFTCALRYVLPSDASLERLAEALRAQGYRPLLCGERLVAQRGRPGRWGSTVVHLSFLAVMLGALSAELGFVGTLNIYQGEKSAVYFDWEKQRDLPLGFEFRLDSFEPIYYPIELRFVSVDPRSGQVLETHTTREGETVALPVPGVRAQVLKFIPFEEHLILGIIRDGAYLGEYHAFGGKRTVANPVDPGVELHPVAFRDPLLRQLHSEVSILEGGEVVKQGVIEVNHPLTYKGVTIYQTAFDQDKFGFWSAGFQFTRDPGEPVVWAGCVGLVLGLLLAFAVPFRAVGVVRVNGEVLLVALAGFRGEGGGRAFDLLERRISGRV